MDSLPEGTEAVFTFWNGMGLWTQIHVLEICSSCKSLDRLVVFRDQDWRRPSDILKQLQEFGDFSWTPHTSGPKPVRSNFIRVVQIRVRSSVGGWDAVLFSRCPSHRRTELRTCARVRCKYLSDSWKSTRSLKLQRKFAFGMLLAPFRQLHFKKINCTI